MNGEAETCAAIERLKRTLEERQAVLAVLQRTSCKRLMLRADPRAGSAEILLRRAQRAVEIYGRSRVKPARALATMASLQS